MKEGDEPMSYEQRRQRDLEERYRELQKEIERRGGVSGEMNKDMLPLEVRVQFLEEVLRFDDNLNGKRRE